MTHTLFLGRIHFHGTHTSSWDACPALEPNLLPLLQRFYRFKWRFQQDNASIHSSASTRRWFIENNVEVLEWPARSPDLNIIESVWGLLARDVYANARQFDSVNQLREAIKAAWNRFSVEQIKKLYASCLLSIVAVIQRHRDITHY